MNISGIATTSSLWSETDARQARGQTFTLNGLEGSWTPEPSEAETEAAEAQPFQIRRELSPEEQSRLEFLQNQLLSLVQSLAEHPSEQNKGRIREIEAEIEKLTGIKSPSSLTKLAAKLPGQKDEKTEEEGK